MSGPPLPEEYVVSSGSMRRVLAVGDRIKVRAALPRELRPGDLVLFISGEQEDSGRMKMVVHRFLWKREEPDGVRLWTMGDASGFVLDRPAPAESLIGKVVAVKRGGGRWRGLEGPVAKSAHALEGLAWGAIFLARPWALRFLTAACQGCPRSPRWRPARRLLMKMTADLDGL